MAQRNRCVVQDGRQRLSEARSPELDRRRRGGRGEHAKGGLAELDTVVAIKNSTSSLAAFVRTFFELGDRLRIFGFGADELSMTLLLHHGGDGTIGGGGALGRDHPDYFNHLWAGDLEAAQACGERDKRFFEFSMYPDFSPKFASAQAVMKAALNVRGLPGGYPRPPYLPLDDDEQERVALFMTELGLVSSPA